MQVHSLEQWAAFPCCPSSGLPARATFWPGCAQAHVEQIKPEILGVKTVVALLWRCMKINRMWSTRNSYSQELACSPSNYVCYLIRNLTVSAHIASLVMINGKWACHICSPHHVTQQTSYNGNKGLCQCLPRSAPWTHKRCNVLVLHHGIKMLPVLPTWRSAAIVPNECHSIGARSGTDSRFLLSSSSAFSRVSGLDSSLIHW